MKKNNVSWIEITTRVGCKVNCEYCPQDKFIKEYSKISNVTQLSFDVFKKCIDKVPKNIYIVFSGFSEPWLNPECTKMILYANKNKYKIMIYTTGIGMTESDIDLIKKIPFKDFTVHLPENRGYTKIKIDQNYLQILNKLYKSNISNIRWIYQAPEKRECIHPKLNNFIKRKKIKLFKWPITSRAGNLENIKNKPKRKKGNILNCSRLNANILLPNGDVVLCCMDWNLKHILGNLLKTNYRSLFKSKEFKNILKELKENSSNILCRTCEWAKLSNK